LVVAPVDVSIVDRDRGARDVDLDHAQAAWRAPQPIGAAENRYRTAGERELTPVIVP
jgi:hypothetical protein